MPAAGSSPMSTSSPACTDRGLTRSHGKIARPSRIELRRNAVASGGAPGAAPTAARSGSVSAAAAGRPDAAPRWIAAAASSTAPGAAAGPAGAPAAPPMALSNAPSAAAVQRLTRPASTSEREPSAAPGTEIRALATAQPPWNS
jgi:hypothetical protein